MKKKYRLINDITIPAGTKVSVEPPHTSKYQTEQVSVLIEVTGDVTAEWHMDLEEAVDEGVIEPIEDDPA